MSRNAVVHQVACNFAGGVDAWLGQPLNQLLACDTTALSPWLDTQPSDE